VRCFSCGKVIGDKYDKYLKLLEEGHSEKEALDILGLERYCCRRMIISNVELIKELKLYDKYKLSK